MRVQGTVTGGRRIATHHIEEIAGALTPLLGAPPIAGTLNVLLDRPVEFSPYEAVLSIKGRYFWNAAINGLPCLAYRWPRCPLHVVEIVSTVHLRTKMSLIDGSAITIESPSLRLLSRQRHKIWHELWASRGAEVYTSDAPTPEGRHHRRQARQAGQRRPRQGLWLTALGSRGVALLKTTFRA
jgi:hypothetical protein